MSLPTVAKRSIYFGGRVTSVTLEDAFWHALKEIARRRRMKLPDLITAIDSQRQDSNLSSAIRLYVLRFYRSQIPDAADREGIPG
jgi:predicted DNA-binding ribbon-helix-helix protein